MGGTSCMVLVLGLVFSILSSFAITLLKKRELVAQLKLFLNVFLTICLQFRILVAPWIDV